MRNEFQFGYFQCRLDYIWGVNKEIVLFIFIMCRSITSWYSEVRQGQSNTMVWRQSIVHASGDMEVLLWRWDSGQLVVNNSKAHRRWTLATSEQTPIEYTKARLVKSVYLNSPTFHLNILWPIVCVLKTLIVTRIDKQFRTTNFLTE